MGRVSTLGHYHVWCLSWDDEASYGADVIGYDDILQHNSATKERGVVYAPSFLLGSAKGAAEAYADYAHDRREGYESNWPLVFRVRCPDGAVQDFEVARDVVATFRASPVEPASDKSRLRGSPHEREAGLSEEHPWLPKGWTYEPRGEIAIIGAPWGGNVTVDFKRRIYCGGIGSGRPLGTTQYTGRGWRDRLCLSALKWLEDIQSKEGR